MSLPEGNEQPREDQCQHGVGTPGQWGDPGAPWSSSQLTRLDPTYTSKYSHTCNFIQITNLVQYYSLVNIPWPSLEHHSSSEPLVRLV